MHTLQGFQSGMHVSQIRTTLHIPSRLDNDRLHRPAWAGALGWCGDGHRKEIMEEHAGRKGCVVAFMLLLSFFFFAGAERNE
jgi:hypothetical protein